MLSEQQHIDDFFRKKDEENQQETGSADIHWEHMKALLKPAAHPTPGKYRLQTTRRIIKYLGGFTVVTVITIVMLTATRSKKNTPAVKPATQKTIAAPKRQPATIAQQKTIVKKAITQPVKPVHQKTYTKAPTQKRTYPNTNDQPERQFTQSKDSTTVLTDQAAQGVQTVSTQIDPTTAVPDAALQLNAFYKQLEKAGQEFVVNVNNDTTLIAKEGTRLTIPAQAFVNKKGPVKSGTVKIVLREYYSYEDILAAKLTTTSGGEQLISGGMVHISAQADGEEVKLAPRKNIKLEMPTSSYDEQMQLFRGNKSSLKNAFVAKFMDNRMIDTVRFMKREADENGELDWIPEGQEQRSNVRFNRKIKVLNIYDNPYRVTSGKKVIAYFNIAKECPLSDEEMAEKLKTSSTVHFDDIKVKRLKRAPKIDPLFPEDVVPVAGDSITILFSEALRRNILTPEQTAQVVEKFRQDSINQENRIREMKKYNFTINNLGWFNCDRFSNDRGPKVLFAFKPGEGFEPATMVSHLVFTRYRSVMPGGYKDNKVRFGRVPKNEPVKIVSIGVKNGRVMSCIQELTTANEEISNLSFEETTPEQFRQKLQTLGLSLP